MGLVKKSISRKYEFEVVQKVYNYFAVENGPPILSSVKEKGKKKVILILK